MPFRRAFIFAILTGLLLLGSLLHHYQGTAHLQATRPASPLSDITIPEDKHDAFQSTTSALTTAPSQIRAKPTTIQSSLGTPFWAETTESKCGQYVVQNGFWRLTTTNEIVAPESDGPILVACDPSGNLIFAKNNVHVFRGDDPITPLNGVDALSFNAAGGEGRYGRDAAHAYWFTWQDWGIIKNADPETFVAPLETSPYAVDATHVFYLGSLVSSADASTFRSFQNSLYARDKKYVYVLLNDQDVHIVVGADPRSFLPFPSAAINGNSLPSHYGRDKMSIYCDDLRLTEADMLSFIPTSDISATDKNGKYVGCSQQDTTNTP